MQTKWLSSDHIVISSRVEIISTQEAGEPEASSLLADTHIILLAEVTTVGQRSSVCLPKMCVWGGGVGVGVWVGGGGVHTV